MKVCRSCCAPACGSICVAAGGCPGVSMAGGTVSIAPAGGGAAVGSGTIAGQVTALARTGTGSRYFSAPAVTISGGGGSGAAATCTVTSGAVDSAFTITNNGTGYTSTPTVTIDPPPAAATATATATMSGGTVASIAVGNPTTNGYYTSAPAVTISAPTLGGTQATATAVLAANRVTSIAVTNAGTLYAGTATVTVAAATTGITATATATKTDRACVGIPSAANYIATVTKTGYFAKSDASTFAACATSARTITGMVPDRLVSTTIHVDGCQGAAFGTPALPSATVEVRLEATGLVVATGVTDAAGNATFSLPTENTSTSISFPNGSSSYRFVVTDSLARFTFNPAGYLVQFGNCDATWARTISATSAITDCFIGVACAWPARTALTLADPRHGILTLTWVGSWRFQDTVSGSLRTWQYNSSNQFTINGSASWARVGSIICPPSFSDQFVVTSNFLDYVVGDTFAISE